MVWTSTTLQLGRYFKVKWAARENGASKYIVILSITAKM